MSRYVNENAQLAVRAAPRPDFGHVVPPPRPAVNSGEVLAPPGLTGAGAVVLMVVAGGAAALLDLLLGAGGTVFTYAFPVACVWAAARVRRRGVKPTLVAPPLVYALIAVAVALHEGSALEVPIRFLAGAPALYFATIAVCVVLAVRRRAGSLR